MKKFQIFAAGRGALDDKTKVKMHAMDIRQQLQVKDERLQNHKMIKVFNHDLRQYIAQQCLNNIHIMTASDFQVIDVIRSPNITSVIECFDVAEVSKDIVCYSTLSAEGEGEIRKSIVVFGLEDTSYLTGIDQKVTQELQSLTKGMGYLTQPRPQHLKWKEYWRCDEKQLQAIMAPGANQKLSNKFFNTLSLSPLGDAMVLGGNECLSLWTRDSNFSTHSYTLHLFYAKDMPENLYAQCLEQQDIKQIIQSEFTSDSRAFLTLEQDNQTHNRTLNVWYNSLMKDVQNFDPRAEYQPSQVDLDDAQYRPRVNRTYLNSLERFVVPAHRTRISCFKMLHISQSFVAQGKVLPIIFMVFTENSQAFLWVEDMTLPPDYKEYHADLQGYGRGKNEDEKLDLQSAYSGMTFSCIHTFSHPDFKMPRHKVGAFDVSFLTLDNNLNSANFTASRINGQSLILDPPGRDHTQRWKIQMTQQAFENMDDEEQLTENSQDFIVCLCSQKVMVYSLKGLRNLPQTFSVQLQRMQTLPLVIQGLEDVSSSRNHSQLMMPSQILVSAQDCLSTQSLLQDQLSLITINKSKHLYKLTTKLSEVEQWPFKIERIRTQSIQQEVESLRILGDDAGAENGSLGQFVIIQSQRDTLSQDLKTVLHFYTEIVNQTEKSAGIRNQKWMGMHDKNVQFLGSYEIAQGAKNSKIVSIKWIRGLGQVIVLYENSKIDIISSDVVSSILKQLNQSGVSNVATKLASLWAARLQNKLVDVFRKIAEVPNELEGAQARGAVIDCEVLNVSFNVNKQEGQVGAPLYTVRLAVFSQSNIEFHDICIGYGATQKMYYETKKLESPSTLTKDNSVSIVELMAQQYDGDEGEDQAYLKSNGKIKCLLKVLNASKQFEIMYVVIEDNTFQIQVLWRKEFPAQEDFAPAKVSAATAKQHQRYGTVPKQASAPLELALDYDVQCRMTPQFATILTHSVKKDWYYLYFFEHKLLNEYVGYLDLLSLIDFEPPLDRVELLKHGFPIDYAFLPSSSNSKGCQTETLLVTCLDSLFVIGLNRLNNKWERIHKVRAISGMDLLIQDSVKLFVTPLGGTIQIYINNMCSSVINSYLKLYGQNVKQKVAEEDEEHDYDESGIQIMTKKESRLQKQKQEAARDEAKMIDSVAQITFSHQRSHPLYSTKVLKDFYTHGKIEFMFKIFIKINEVLAKEHAQLDFKNKEKELAGQITGNAQGLSQQADTNAQVHLSNVLNYSIKELLKEINDFVEAQVQQQEEPAKKEKQQNNNFDDFFGGGDDDDDDFDLMGGGLIDFDNLPAPGAQVKSGGGKKQAEQEVVQVESSEKKFLEIYEELLKNINKTDALEGQGILEFLLIFRDIYSKDFFSDEMATILMREVYLDTHYANFEKLKELEAEKKPAAEERGIVKKLESHEIYAQMYGEKDDGDFVPETYEMGKGNIRKLGKWSSKQCLLALYTVNQDVILEELRARFDLEENASWELIRNLSLPVWFKDVYKLREMIGWIANMAYKQVQEDINRNVGRIGKTPSKAEATAIWYILMNKKSRLINLYEQERATGGDKVAGLLSQDFSTEKARTIALKNAFAVRQRQKYGMCATLFILGNDITSALQVMKQNFRDPIMAILACRMLQLQQPQNEEIPKYLNQIYEEYFIERGKKFGDVNLVSIGLWGQEKYVQAVNALQVSGQNSSNAKEEAASSDLGTDQLFAQDNGFQFNQDVVEVAESQKKVGEKPNDILGAQKDGYLPLVCTATGYHFLNMLSKLKKAPKVTHALKATGSNQGGGYGADEGDLLGDFFGGPSTQAKQKKAEKAKEEIEKPKLEIDSGAILNEILLESLTNNDPFHALFILRENKDLINPYDKAQLRYIQMLCSQMIKDSLEEIRSIPSYMNSFVSLKAQIANILDFMLGIEQKDLQHKPDQVQAVEEPLEASAPLLIVKRHLQRCIEKEILHILEKLQGLSGKNLGGNTLLRYELELRLEARQCQVVQSCFSGIQIPRVYCSMKSILLRMEEQTVKFLDFIRCYTDEPLLLNTARCEEQTNLQTYRDLILDLEQHIECLLIFDHYEDPETRDFSLEDDQLDAAAQPQAPSQVTQDMLEYRFFTEAAKTPAEAKKQEKPAKEKKQAAFDPFADMMGGDDSDDGIDLMDFDFSAPPKKKEEKKKATEAEFDEESVDVIKGENKYVLSLLKHYQVAQGLMQRLGSKIRKNLVMHICLVILAYLMGKFYIVKELLSSEDLQKVLKIDVKVIIALKMKLAELRREIEKLKLNQDAVSDLQRASLYKDLKKKLDETLQAVRGQYGLIHFQNLKTHIQKFKCAIEKRISKIGDLVSSSAGAQAPGMSQFMMPRAEVAADGQEALAKVAEENVHQERWETDLVNAEDAHQVAGGRSNEEEEKKHELPTDIQQTLGMLSDTGQVNPNTYEFIKLWLKFIIINSTKEQIEDALRPSSISNQQEPTLSSFINESPALNMQQEYEGDGCTAEVMDQLCAVSLNQELQDFQFSLLRPRFNLDELVSMFNRMSKVLEDECTLFFKQRLNVMQRRYMVKQISSIQTSLHLFPLLMQYFFKNQEKLTDFWVSLDIASKYAKPLSDQFLTLLGQSCTCQQDEYELMEHLTYPPISRKEARKRAEKPRDDRNVKRLTSQSATQLITRDLLGTGIELFKQRGEQINDFSFDNTANSDNIALGLMTSGIREIPVVNTLLLRNRIESGLQLIDEEPLKWEECLHRYDAIEQIMYGNVNAGGVNSQQPEIIHAKDEPITTAIDSLYAHKTIFHRSKPLRRQGLQLLDTELKPAQIWNGQPSSNYLTQTSRLAITHEDYTYSVESHPHLPLYVSGNRRGILCTWRFGQAEDTSLNQFMPETDPRQADPKKACVKKIMFNLFGDKIMSNNMEGSFSVYQIECNSRSMRKIPIFSLYENVDSRVTDFDLINSDNIICTISQKQKTVKVYDTLLPYCFGKQAQVMEYKLPQGNSAGNLILCNQRRQILMTFNGRTGAMTELDLRMNLQQVNQFQLSQSHEITAVCLNQRKDTLVSGYRDGHIKIHSLDKYYENQDKLRNMQHLHLREKIEAFPFDFRGKKGTVQRIKINQKNGGMFASSQSGILKLMRTTV